MQALAAELALLLLVHTVLHEQPELALAPGEAWAVAAAATRAPGALVACAALALSALPLTLLAEALFEWKRRPLQHWLAFEQRQAAAALAAARTSSLRSKSFNAKCAPRTSSGPPLVSAPFAPSSHPGAGAVHACAPLSKEAARGWPPSRAQKGSTGEGG